MKQTLLFICFFISGLILTQAQTYSSTIPGMTDQDFIYAVFAGNSGIDLDSNNILDINEANNWTGTLNLSSRGISNLTGIEAFKNITRLECAHNSLTNLDVSMLINLEYLNCSANYLSSLNLSNNTSLTSLSCSDNGLTNLDLTNLNNLETLHCNDNSISNLELPTSSRLEHLSCQNNNLDELNLTHLIKLKSLNCWENNLTSLNLSNQSYLIRLSCWSNNLKYLNIKNGNNSNLTFFNAFNNNLSCIKADPGFTSPRVDLINGNLNLRVPFDPNCCFPTNTTAFTFPSNNYVTGTYPIILVSNATIETEVRISTDITFTTFNLVSQSSNPNHINKFPTSNLSLCYNTTYYIQTRDNQCSTWTNLRSFTTRNYAKQWVDNISNNKTTPTSRTLGKSLVTNLPNSGVNKFEWYIEDVTNSGNILPTPFYTTKNLSGNPDAFRYLKINNTIANLLVSGHVYRVVVKGHIGTACGSFNNNYPIIPVGDPKYRSAYFIYEEPSPSNRSILNSNTFENSEMNKEISINLTAYPNPSNSGVFKMELVGFNPKKTIQVINLNGQIVLEFDLNESKTAIDLSPYKKGIYAVRIDDGITIKQLKLITK